MKIAYIGNFEPRHSTENHVRLSLEQLGHEVIRIQENRCSPRGIETVVAHGGAELVIYTRTWGLPGPEMLALWARLKARGIPTVSYHLDLYCKIARSDLYERLRPWGITGIGDDPFWRTEYVCTVDGDPESQAFFEGLGINHHWVRAGVFAQECYLTPAEERFPLVFVGSYGYHPEWPWRPQLIDWLGATYGNRFRLFPTPGKPAIRNEDLNNLYAQTGVVVGDSLVPGFTHKRYWSDRVYETLGRGGFLIHPHIEGMELEFRDGEHLIFFEHGNLEDLREKVDYYLDPINREEREAIRSAGHEMVATNCTYVHRMREILEIVCGKS